MKKNEISIILPVYNKQKYISKILYDIKEQIFKEFECIIVDDGSTDNSKRICEQVVKSDDRFVLVHTQNRGVSHARNVGISRANGTYITFIDADDRVGPDYLKRLYRAACESKADMVIAGYEKWWEEKDKRIKIDLPYNGLWRMEDLLQDFATIQKKTGIYGFCWGKLLKTQKFYNIRFDENYVLAEDFEYYLRIYPMMKTIYFDNKTCYFYLQQAENSSMIIEDNKIDYLSQLYLNIKFKKFLQKMNAYSGENKKIVEQLMSNYAFFTIFHTNRLYIKDNMNKVYQIVKKENIMLNGTNLMQKVLLHFVKFNDWKKARTILLIYDFLRKKLR